MQPDHPMLATVKQFIIAPTHQSAMKCLSEIGQNPKDWIVLANTNPVAWEFIQGCRGGKALYIVDGNYSNVNRLDELLFVAEQRGVEIQRVHLR